jgi:outer membrane protein TolC
MHPARSIIASTIALIASLTTTAACKAQSIAASPRDSSVLRLATLYELAARRSPQLEAARALARAAAARIPSTKRPPDPELQIGFMNRSLPSFAPMDPLGMTSLQVMQMLPLNGKLALTGRVATEQAGAARDRADEVRWDVRSRVAMAFYDLYATDRAIAVANDTRRLLQSIAKTAQSMYAVGDGRQADVLKAQVEVARMTEDIVRMHTMRTSAIATLTALVNATLDSALGTAESPELPLDLPPLDTLQRLAEEHRPMIRAGLAEVRAADARSTLAAREIWPDLQVGVQYGQRSGAMGTERMASLMLGATLPVFAGSRQYRMRDEAEAMKVMALADLATMRAQTRARVADLHATITRARNLSELYRGSVLPQSRAAVTSALAAYRVGQVNLMTLLDNQMTVNRYEQELFTLEAEQGKAIAELEMMIGRELLDASAARTRAAGRGTEP